MNTKSKPRPASVQEEFDTSTDIIVKQWEKERPDLDFTAFGILLRMRGIAMLMERRNQPVAEALGLKSSDLWVLYALRRSGEPYCLRPTDIFKLLKVTSGTVTYRIDRLEKTGMVKRVPDAEDRRSIMIQLTAKGKRIVDTSVQTLAADAASRLQFLTKDKALTATLISVLRQLGAYYDQEIPDEDNPLLHLASKQRSSSAKAAAKGASKKPRKA